MNDHRGGDRRNHAGLRAIAERLWPRGVKKSNLKLAAWLHDAAPSTALRQSFGHEPARWEEFKRRYFRELEALPTAWEPILIAAATGPVTLIFSSRDTEHNNVVALRSFLIERGSPSSSVS
jgi:uncharacterized protein YeaO (DUF488 family)